MYKGIDISHWQGKIDFNKVITDNIDFVMIRSGYGVFQKDSMFEYNVEQCRRLNIDWGVYHYSNALNTEQAEREAEETINLIKGYKPSYPVVFDMEDADGYKQKNGVTEKNILVKMCKTFCDVIEKNNYYACIYSSLSWFNYKLNDTILDKYDKWLAQWSDKPSYNKSFGIWQYSNSGNVAGIDGNVDLNISYKNYPEIMKKYGLNGFEKEEEKEVRYNKVSEIPSWGKETVNKLIEKGVLKGDGNNLNISEDMLRILVINDRIGLYS